ncbi:MAG: lytic transglycosylase domain-containing protein [Candidatus Competibacteraceae bacterium]|nr:lytic transglycosylase domain-containing protein [Candidatus Competibacteraceae bacterium]
MRKITLVKGVPVNGFKSPLLVLLAWLVPLTTVSAYNHSSPQVEAWIESPKALMAVLKARRNGRLVEYLQERFNLDGNKADMIVSAATRNALERGLQPELVLAVIAVESTFRERAISPVGAKGLMQIMARYHPKKVRSIGGVQALFDPVKNIYVGSLILSQYLELSRGNLRNALLRYNGSLGNPRSRYADKVLRVYEDIKTFNTLPQDMARLASDA